MSPGMAAAHTADLSHRLAQPEDVPAILQLIASSLGSSNPAWGERFWRWKHEENPFGRSPCMLAIAEEHVVGLRVFMRWTWRAGGRDVRAVRAVDTVTHPDWRGRGIFSTLTLALVERVQEDGVELVFNTPNSASRPGYLKMGWESVGRVAMMMRLLRPLRVARCAFRQGTRCRPSRAEPVTTLGQPASEMMADSNLPGLLQRATSSDPRLRTPRAPDYLAWRYDRTPVVGYRAAWEVSGESGAAVFFRLVSRGDLRELRVCDLIVPPDAGSVRCARRLLRELCSTSGADYAAAMAAPGTPARRALMASLFLPVPRVGPVLTVRPLSSRVAPDPRHRNSWNLSIGDLELF